MFNEENRIQLANLLNAGANSREICETLNVSRWALRREIINNSTIGESYDHIAPCVKLKRFPYCCNACKNFSNCHAQKHKYIAKNAIKRAMYRRSLAHKGIRFSKEHLDKVDAILYESIVIKRQSLHTVVINNPNIGISERHLYNLIGLNTFTVRNIDIRRKQYRKTKVIKKSKRVADDFKNGHKYEDFVDFIAKNNDLIVVELDTVHGKQSDKKCFLTMTFRRFRFQFVFLLESCTTAEVNKTIYELYEVLGETTFKKMFQVILADNGTEFNSLIDFAKDSYGNPFIEIFYTRPYKSSDKGLCENNHRIIRYRYPKGKSLESVTKEDAIDLTNHINSFPKASLNDFTPYELMEMKFGEKTLKKLGVKKISPKDVDLKEK